MVGGTVTSVISKSLVVCVLGAMNLTLAYPPVSCMIEVSPFQHRCLKVEWDGHCSHSEWIRLGAFTQNGV